MDIKVATGETQGVKIITLSGEIDIYTAPELREGLLSVADSAGSIVADLKDVTFLDSTGLGVFVGALKRLRLNGGDLVLTSLNDRVGKVFAVTGLDKVFKVYPALEDALSDLNTEVG